MKISALFRIFLREWNWLNEKLAKNEPFLSIKWTMRERFWIFLSFYKSSSIYCICSIVSNIRAFWNREFLNLLFLNLTFWTFCLITSILLPRDEPNANGTENSEKRKATSPPHASGEGGEKRMKVDPSEVHLHYILHITYYILHITYYILHITYTLHIDRANLTFYSPLRTAPKRASVSVTMARSTLPSPSRWKLTLLRYILLILMTIHDHPHLGRRWRAGTGPIRCGAVSRQEHQRHWVERDPAGHFFEHCRIRRACFLLDCVDFTLCKSVETFILPDS